jgi:hypothetical protein
MERVRLGVSLHHALDAQMNAFDLPIADLPPGTHCIPAFAGVREPRIFRVCQPR